MDKDKIEQDGEIARIRRRRMKHGENDEDQDNEQAIFKSNPMNAINKHSKQRTQKNIEKQISYFGNVIEPFHMHDEQQLGEMDEDGFFVFNRKNKVKDAWLNSIGEGEQGDVAGQLVKKIQEEGRFQSVYEAGEKINGNLNQNEQQEEQNQSYEGGGIEQAPQSEQSDPNQGLSVQELIQIMVELIPDNSNANNYMKKLKKDKKNDEYNKLLTISNEYIEKTGQYDILTKKKEELQEMLDQIVEKKKDKLKLDMYKQKEEKEEQVLDWDNDNQDSGNLEAQNIQKKESDRKEVSENESDSDSDKNDDDNDDIF